MSAPSSSAPSAPQNVDDVVAALQAHDYLPDEGLATVIYLAMRLHRSLLAEGEAGVGVYPPVPPSVSRVADVERMQMLVESSSRPALQRFLAGWLPQLLPLRARHKGLLRWAVDVDPLAI